MKPRLTAPQERLLVELSEPNKNEDNCWFFPRKNLTGLQTLAKHGLAKYIDEDAQLNKFGFAITDAGRARLKKETP